MYVLTYILSTLLMLSTVKTRNTDPFELASAVQKDAVGIDLMDFSESDSHSIKAASKVILPNILDVLIDLVLFTGGYMDRFKKYHKHMIVLSSLKNILNNLPKVLTGHSKEFAKDVLDVVNSVIIDILAYHHGKKGIAHKHVAMACLALFYLMGKAEIDIKEFHKEIGVLGKGVMHLTKDPTDEIGIH